MICHDLLSTGDSPPFIGFRSELGGTRQDPWVLTYIPPLRRGLRPSIGTSGRGVSLGELGSERGQPQLGDKSRQKPVLYWSSYDGRIAPRLASSNQKRRCLRRSRRARWPSVTRRQSRSERLSALHTTKAAMATPLVLVQPQPPFHPSYELSPVGRAWCRLIPRR